MPAAYLELFHLNKNIAVKSRKKTIENVQVSHPENNAKWFSSATKLCKEMGNVRKREKEFCPISKSVFFSFSRKFGSAWEGYDFSQTLVDVHPLLVQNLR